MIEVVTIATACTGALTCAVGFVRALNRHVVSPPADSMSPIWNTRNLQDGTWAVVTRDQVADLGIDEDTVYGGYTYDQAFAVAKWLNDGGDDRRALADVLRDVEDRRKARVDQEAHRPGWGGNFSGPTVEEHIRSLSKRIAGSMAVPPARLGQRLFGVMTRDDILAFQQALQLKTDGILGPATSKAIYELIQRETQPPDTCNQCESIYQFGSSKSIGCTCGQVHTDDEPQWFTGDGPPTHVIGASPGDRYIDRTTGDTYMFDDEPLKASWQSQPPVLRQALRLIWTKQADHLSRSSPTRGEKR